MTTETQPERPVLTDDETNQEQTGVRPSSRRVAYKTVLVAVVIGIFTISVLWAFVIRDEGNPADAIVTIESDIQMYEDTEGIGTELARSDDKYDQIDRRVASLSGRIDRGFETQQNHSMDVKRGLTTMAESVQQIKASVADLVEGNKALSQRISEAISQLDTLARNIRARKVVKRPTIKHKPRSAKTPPFHVDAIDIWDDTTYVAVSQAGRAAFLKAGEQQSGWTVTRIDRIKGQVDFQGPAGQAHSVSLKR